MLERLIGVFKLDASVYEQIEHDENATMQALIVVAIAGFLSGVGNGIGASLNGGNFFFSFITIFVWAIIGWVIWAYITHFIGTRIIGGKGTVIGLMRGMGYAQAPLILGVVPCLGLVGLLWALATGWMAVRQGLDLDSLQAVVAIVLGGLVYWIGLALIIGATGVTGLISG